MQKIFDSLIGNTNTGKNFVDVIVGFFIGIGLLSIFGYGIAVIGATLHMGEILPSTLRFLSPFGLILFVPAITVFFSYGKN